MKIAPILEAMNRHPDRIDQMLVHTGQHYDEKMSKAFFEDLGMPRPDIEVEVEVGPGSHAVQTGRVVVFPTPRWPIKPTNLLAETSFCIYFRRIKASSMD